MANRFPDKTCVLCVDPSDGVGEHVLSAWLIEIFAKQGPFTTYVGTKPVSRRDGITPWTSEALTGLHVPMCCECNSKLSIAIENSAARVGKMLFSNSASQATPSLNRAEVEALARWVVKAAVLRRHPDAESDNPRLRLPEGYLLDRLDSDWTAWMDGSELMPEHFSVYLTRETERPAAAPEHLTLPRVLVAGKDLQFAHFGFGVGQLKFAVAWHPGWAIVHPLIEAKQAMRLWPNPEPIDVADLVPIDSGTFTIRESGGEISFRDDPEYAQMASTPLTCGEEPWGLFMARLGE